LAGFQVIIFGRFWVIAEAYGEWINSVLRLNPRFLEMVTSEISKDEKLIVGCDTGKGRSTPAAEALKAAGFTNIFDMSGGIAEWSRRGFPTNTK
jgi:rhodanese-related sulfurtransferase